MNSTTEEIENSNTNSNPDAENKYKFVYNTWLHPGNNSFSLDESLMPWGLLKVVCDVEIVYSDQDTT